MPAIDLWVQQSNFLFICHSVHTCWNGQCHAIILIMRKMCCNAISLKTLLALLINFINDRKLKRWKILGMHFNYNISLYSRQLETQYNIQL